MKYSIRYYKDFRYFNEIDEIILDYHEHNDNIIDFIKNVYKPFQRIVICLKDKESEIDSAIPILQKLKQEHPNFTVKITPLFLDKIVIKLKNAGIAFFVDEFCRIKEQVFYLVNLGVSDVYINEDLGFDLIEVSKYCHSQGVLVRVIPNVISQYTKITAECIKAFFIRPEDIRMYEPCVDICELQGSPDRYSVIYEIYKSGRWQGQLSDIITGFDENANNINIYPSFGQYRLSCKHICMYEKCNLCKEIQSIANELEDKGLEFKKYES